MLKIEVTEPKPTTVKFSELPRGSVFYCSTDQSPRQPLLKTWSPVVDGYDHRYAATVLADGQGYDVKPDDECEPLDASLTVSPK